MGSEPSKHLQSNINNCFIWAVISNTRKNAKSGRTQKHYIALWRPDLNKGKDFERLLLFRNGVTESN